MRNSHRAVIADALRCTERERDCCIIMLLFRQAAPSSLCGPVEPRSKRPWDTLTRITALNWASLTDVDEMLTRSFADGRGTGRHCRSPGGAGGTRTHNPRIRRTLQYVGRPRTNCDVMAVGAPFGTSWHGFDRTTPCSPCRSDAPHAAVSQTAPRISLAPTADRPLCYPGKSMRRRGSPRNGRPVAR